MPYETLLTERTDSILTVTLNRPERLNAFTLPMLEDWLRLADEIDADDDVRAVVVTGAGRGFCAGADLEAGGSTFDTGSRVREAPRDGGGAAAPRGAPGPAAPVLSACRNDRCTKRGGPA